MKKRSFIQNFAQDDPIVNKDVNNLDDDLDSDIFDSEPSADDVITVVQNIKTPNIDEDDDIIIPGKPLPRPSSISDEIKVLSPAELKIAINKYNDELDGLFIDGKIGIFEEKEFLKTVPGYVLQYYNDKEKIFEILKPKSVKDRGIATPVKIATRFKKFKSL